MSWCVKQIGGDEYCGFESRSEAWWYIRQGWRRFGIRYTKNSPYWKPY